MSEEVYTLIGVIGMILMMSVGFSLTSKSSISMSKTLEAYDDSDKTETDGALMTYSDPYVMTAYQAYMTGRCMDNYGLNKYPGISYVASNDDKVILSPKDYDYSYSARNITLHQKVLPNIKSSAVTGAKNWFRGFDTTAGKRQLYHLQLTNEHNNGGSVEWTMSCR